ncbi:MAG: M50 family metallopeptidase [Anaerolineales bacterium]|nr:M50 family metallopeptidase [Anaerolineales bacterium]
MTGIARGVAALPGGDAGEATVQVVGPLGLKQFSDRALSNAVEWELAYPVLYLGAWLSTTVGLVNPLPLPALDGVHAAGMVLLLLVLLVLTGRDVAARLA